MYFTKIKKNTMSTRSSRRGVRPPIADNIVSKNSTEFLNYDDLVVKRSMRSRTCRNIPSLQTECKPVLEKNYTRKVLEKNDIEDQTSSMNVHSKNKRSRKQRNDPSTGIVENENHNEKIKNIDDANIIVETKLPVKISTRKSTRNNKHKAALDTDSFDLLEATSELFTDVNKENENGHFTFLKTKKMSKRGKEIIIETSFKSDDNYTSLPSKRGSTGGCSRIAASAPRTRRALRSNLDKTLKNEVITAKRKGRNKNSYFETSNIITNAENISATDIKNDKNLSNISNDTLYHSLDGPDYPNSVHKDDLSFSSVKEFELSDSKHSSLTKSISNSNKAKACINASLPKTCKIQSRSFDSDLSQILNETYPILVDDSVTSDSSFKNKISAIFSISSKDTTSIDASGFMKNSKNNMRISGIEEILAGNAPVTRKSLKHVETFTSEVPTVATVNSSLNKTADISHNHNQFSQRRVFSAASPCKLFPNKASLNTDKGKKNEFNFTFTKTPPKTTCRAISVGSAGRTPMPSDKSSQKSILFEEKSTPIKIPTLLNVTHSLEKPNEQEILAGNAPVTRKSLKREGTYTKEEGSTVATVNSSFNKTADTSHNQNQFSQQHVFSAASPCKLFPKKSSLNTDKGKMSVNNFTFTKTPPKTTCRAISVGSAGRTPMPSDKFSQERFEEKSTPIKIPALLNVTHSLEKPKEQEVEPSIISDASVNKKTKVGFSTMNKTQMSRIPNPSKIIKSNLKGSNKSFTFANSVTKKQGTRKRSLTQNDTETRGAKIRKLGLRELNVIGSCMAQPKTPASAGKHLYAKADASICSTTPAKQTAPKLAAPLSRSKMPDFASLHKKQFEQMESLVQNKARKAERARQLLFSNLPDGLKSTNKLAVTKDEKPAKIFFKSSSDIEFTRFGFKLQSGSQKNVMKPCPLPVAKSNKAEARKVIMREDKPSAIEKRRMENRNYVRGVRTNRRFELQMQSRNLPI